jgi:hypothetical protein
MFHRREELTTWIKLPIDKGRTPSRPSAAPPQTTPRATDAQQEEFLTRLEGSLEDSRQHAQTLHEDVLTRLHEGLQETQRHMRLLHEDAIGRIALLQDSSAGASANAKNRKRRKR